MEPERAIQIIDFLTSSILVTSFLVLGSKRLLFSVQVIFLQAMLLVGVTTVMAVYTGDQEIYLAAFFTFLIKALIIPYVLYRVIRKINLKKDTYDFIGNKVSLVLAGVLVILSFVVVPETISPGSFIGDNALTVAVALLILGLFEMITRKLAVMQIIGLLMMENGLFLAGVGTNHGMPLVVELGIFLDILVGVLIMGVLIFKINNTFDTIDTNQLKNLKG